MRKYLLTGLLSVSMLGMPMIVGCDRTLHENEKTTSGPNGQTTTDEKTVEHPDGTVTKESSKSTNPNP